MNIHNFDPKEYKIHHRIINQSQNENTELKDHAVLAISPFNGYFTEENITKLIGWAIKNFKGISVFIPDGWSVYTLMAQGYTEEKARKKTKLQDSNLKNKVIRAFTNNGICEKLCLDYFVTSEILTNDKNYCEIYEKCINKFDTDQIFRDVCLSASRNLLSKNNENVTEDMLNIAVKYILLELPIYLDSPKILNVPSSFMVYHKVSDVEKYIYRKNSMSALNQSYIVASISD